jgi:GNAT superfamily N-acetyltransferase
MELVRIEGPGPRLEEARALLREYWTSFGFTPCFQGFDAELAALPGEYAPPRGVLFLAQGGGCVAVRPLRGGMAEMKRLYVRPQARGTGLGRRLAQAALAHARELGFARMLLDTMPAQMAEAVALYRSMGFLPAAPYSAQPTPGALCMELSLR